MVVGVEGNVFFDLASIEGLRFGGGVTYYFEAADVIRLSVDPNAHYAFVRREWIDVYAMAGLNLLYWRYPAGTGLMTSDLGIGVGTGIGIEGKLGALHPYAEGKVALPYPLVGLFGGVRFAF